MIDAAVPMLALSYTNDAPIRILAVIGAGAMGAFVIGALLQVLVKVAFGQQVPRWPMWGIRGLGGVICGWIVYALLNGPGGGFGGGGGGLFGGGGSGSGDKNAKVEPKKDKETKDKEKMKDKESKIKAPPEQTVKIEVLGKDAVKKLTKSGSVDLDKRYRIVGETQLYSLKEVKTLIKERRQVSPPLKQLVVVIYLDSPAQGNLQVSELVDWVRDLDPERGKIEVGFELPPRKATD